MKTRFRIEFIPGMVVLIQLKKLLTSKITQREIREGSTTCLLHLLLSPVLWKPTVGKRRLYLCDFIMRSFLREVNCGDREFEGYQPTESLKLLTIVLYVKITNIIN